MLLLVECTVSKLPKPPTNGHLIVQCINIAHYPGWKEKKKKDGKNSAQSSAETPGENSASLHSEALLCSSAQESSLQLCQLWVHWQQEHRYLR